MRTMAKRFYDNVIKGEAVADCWIWSKWLDKDGYGRMTFKGKKYAAHRLSRIVNNGEIPYNLYVLHKCDNPSCVNPDHLFLGTQQDNIDDCRNKGRANTSHNFKKIYGSSNGSSHITEQDVLNIRLRYDKGVQQKILANQFGIGRATVWAIVHRHSWTHI
jgi:hypothetical protein